MSDDKLPLIFSCSGCSDVGEVADRAARSLARSGNAKMSCIAGVGGRVAGILNPLRKAERVMVVDGCKLHCARHTMEAAGITGFTHVSLAELALVKHQTPADPETVARVAGHLRGRLAGK